MRRRPAALAIVSLFLTCGISACGGASGNGVASKSPDAIVTEALDAIDSAKSAHIYGSVTSGDSPTTLNLDLLAGKGGRGEVSVGDLVFMIEVVGNDVYINGNPAFVNHFFGTAALRQFQGRWLKAPSNGQFAFVAQVSNLQTLVRSLLVPHGTLVKSGTRTIDGRSAIGVRDETRDATLYVATRGKPYPLEILSGGGSKHGRLTLGAFNESVSLTPPLDPVDISKLK